MVPGTIPGGVTWDFFRCSFRQNHVPWGRFSLWKWVPGTSPGVKTAGAFGWRPTTLVVPKVEKIRGLNYLGLSRNNFTFYFYSHLRFSLQSAIVLLGFHTKSLYVFLLFPLRATCTDHLIVQDLLTWVILLRNTHYEASRNAYFVSFIVLLPSQFQNIFLSTLFSKILTNVLPLMGYTQIRPHIERQAFRCQI